MPRKMPQKPIAHNNDRLAKRNLEDHFGNWNIARVEDESSGIEYGQDWMIGIIDANGGVTSLEFRVQSKVLRGKNAIRGDYICDQILVSTINYLYGLSVPVLFHFYHEPSQQGYAMWLGPWYVQNRKEKWERQNTITVKIPLSSRLDNSMVEQLRNYVMKDHHTHKMHRAADLINETSSDHSVKFESIGNDTTIVINAKHDGAIPIIMSLDDESKAALQEALDTGVRTQITGEIGIKNIPSILLQEMNLNHGQLTIIPRLMDLPSFPIRVQYLDENGQVVYETKYVDMTPVQHGRLVRKWAGKAFSGPVQYILEYNSIRQTCKFNFKILEGDKDPVDVNEYFDAVQAIAKACRCRVIDPRNDEVLLDSRIEPEFQMPDLTRAIGTLARSLATITSFTGIAIEMPDEFSGEDLQMAEEVARMLKTGIYNQSPKEIPPDENVVIILTGTQEWAEEIEVSLNSNPEPLSYPHRWIGEVHAEVLGQDIDLGPCEFVFAEIKLLEKRPGAEEVQLIFAFDREKSYSRLTKWYKET